MPGGSRNAAELRAMLADRFGETKATYLVASDPSAELLAVLRELIEVEPRDWHTRAKLVNGLRKRGLHAEALAVLDLGLASCGADPARGDCCLAEMIELSDVLSERASILWEMSRREESVDQMRARCRIKADVSYRGQLIERLHSMGRHQEVLDEAADLIGIMSSGTLPQAAMWVALSCAALGDRRRAAELLQFASCGGAVTDSVRAELDKLGYRVVETQGRHVLKKKGWLR